VKKGGKINNKNILQYKKKKGERLEKQKNND